MSQEPDTVDVWLVPTDLPAPVLEELSAHLDADELHRAANLPDPTRRARFVAAHGALRSIIAGRLGMSPATLRWSHGLHGKPELADLAGAPRVSLSHCAGLALVALSRRRCVGVDIERMPADRDAIRLAARYFPPAQAAFVAAADSADSVNAADEADEADEGVADSAAGRFTTLWSRKEACVKVRGGRLVEGFPLAVHGSAPLAVRDGEGPGDAVYLVHDLPAPQRHRAAVALAGPEPSRVRWHAWAPASGQSADPAIGQALSLATGAAQTTKTPKRDSYA